MSERQDDRLSADVTSSITSGEPATAVPAKKGLLTRGMDLLKRYKLLVRVIVLALILVFLGTGILKSWGYLANFDWNVQWWLFLAAFALLITQEFSYAFIWRSILDRLGSRLDIVSSQRIYLGAEFVRYIPGNVWHVITRVLWAEQRGVPKTRGFASMVIELATKISAAALVFFISLFFWPDVGALTSKLDIPHDVLVVSGAILIPLLLLGLYPQLLQAILNFGLRKTGREPITITLHYSEILLITFFWMLSWLVAGVGFYLLVHSIDAHAALSPANLAIAIGIYAIAWDVGFVSFVTPSGLGFREAAMILLLTASNLVPDLGLAIVLAFVTRILATGAELFCISLAHLIPGAPVPPQVEILEQAQAELR